MNEEDQRTSSKGDANSTIPFHGSSQQTATNETTSSPGAIDPIDGQLMNVSADHHASSNSTTGNVTNNITIEEYFTSEVNLTGRDIGRPKKINTKV